MNFKEIIKEYLKGLEDGDYAKIIKLFSTNATINSPLYGKIMATKFYNELFKDTSRSKITLLNVFKGEEIGTAAGHFLYEWILKDGKLAKFECVDIFRFNEDGQILELTIIYDTHDTRKAFEKMKRQ